MSIGTANEWELVRRIMERSIRGTPPTSSEALFLTKMSKADRKRYQVLQSEVKRRTIEEATNWKL